MLTLLFLLTYWWWNAIEKYLVHWFIIVRYSVLDWYISKFNINFVNRSRPPQAFLAFWSTLPYQAFCICQLVFNLCMYIVFLSWYGNKRLELKWSNLHKSADCRWISKTYIEYCYRNSATVCRLVQSPILQSTIFCECPSDLCDKGIWGSPAW